MTRTHERQSLSSYSQGDKGSNTHAFGHAHRVMEARRDRSSEELSRRWWSSGRTSLFRWAPTLCFFMLSP